VCGNALVEGEEECDDGTENSDTVIDSCRTNCTFAHCGDGVVDTGEMCDDRNNVGGDGCSADCLSNERCGNGIPDQGTWEKCDDGNDVDWDGCRRCEISEFRINTYTLGSQWNPSVAVSHDGSFVVVWQSAGQDGYGFGVFGQRCDAFGTPVGAEFQVNTDTQYGEEVPSVAVSPAGGFVVVWQSGTSEHPYDIHGQRYDSSGIPDGAAFRVNTFIQGDQTMPSVAMADDGSFVVVWSSWGKDGSGDGVFGQRYDSSGEPSGFEFQINTYTQDDQNWPVVAASADSRFVVVWESLGQDGSGKGIFGRLHDPAGDPATPEFRVNSHTESQQEFPSVSMTSDASFVVVWSGDEQGGYTDGVFGQRYDSVGNSVGPEFKVNTFEDGRQYFPSVSTAADGRFVVVWMSEEQDGDGWGVFGQRYDSSGERAGPEFQVNGYTQDGQWFAAVSMSADGNFVVAWESKDQDGDQEDIFAQRYTADGEPIGHLPWP
jgi:cysteine-rich repeat protein